ncbi:hypothetical protein AURDEDRAFT_70921, partial [Auricularia subglabra TFB-10046 SS5]
RPSERLRRICPLCFGGYRPGLKLSLADILVCIDACFGQKRRKSSQTDGPLQHSDGRFVPESEILAMEREVASKRQGPGKKRARGAGPLPSEEVLDECEQSFIAAQEKVVKASKNYYADTGLMALLCRHDRVLWIANMTSPGERQHYALVLLRQLAKELPESWRIGLLYDIACQIRRSIEKVRHLCCHWGKSLMLDSGTYYLSWLIG